MLIICTGEKDLNEIQLFLESEFGAEEGQILYFDNQHPAHQILHTVHVVNGHMNDENLRVSTTYIVTFSNHVFRTLRQHKPFNPDQMMFQYFSTKSKNPKTLSDNEIVFVEEGLKSGLLV